MIKIESKHGDVSVELEGNILEIATDFDHAVMVSLDKLGEQREENGLATDGEGALKCLSKLVLQFIAKESGAKENPFVVIVKADEFNALEEKITNFIKSEIDALALNLDEVEEIKSDAGIKMLFEFLFGVKLDEEEPEQEQPDRPTAVWMHTGINGEWECSNCKSQVALSDDVHGHPRFCSICGYEMIASVEPEGEADGTE